MTKIALPSTVPLLVIVFLGAAIAFAVGCTLYRPTAYAEGLPEEDGSLVSGAAMQSSTSWRAGERPDARRVGGDLQATVVHRDGAFRSGDCRVPTPLPEGYPPPTPPGAIDLKRYPSVRRAAIAGRISPDWGMNVAFFPLFNHIKRRDIAMTSPVEVNYEGLATGRAEAPVSWTMSFLYRTRDQGPQGVDPQDQRILVEDVPPMRVVSIGMQGPYRLRSVKRGLAELRAWLSTQPHLKEAGEPRALFYNGPEVRSRDQWWEVQIPIQSPEAASAPSPATSRALGHRLDAGTHRIEEHGR